MGGLQRFFQVVVQALATTQHQVGHNLSVVLFTLNPDPAQAREAPSTLFLCRSWCTRLWPPSTRWAALEH